MHPWILLWTTLKEQGRTQKKFAFLAWKKVSEVNELIKGKRNITIQRDYLLHNILWTPLKYRVNLQIDFDYQHFIENLPPEVDTVSLTPSLTLDHTDNSTSNSTPDPQSNDETNSSTDNPTQVAYPLDKGEGGASRDSGLSLSDEATEGGLSENTSFEAETDTQNKESLRSEFNDKDSSLSPHKFGSVQNDGEANKAKQNDRETENEEQNETNSNEQQQKNTDLLKEKERIFRDF